eukprot:TRINITY_DN10789_c0_g1_i1.p1 TRINITY_DN10789_c0_g1~~TRINITY_DN10789_c0_g1_i1.p1  ORF type:complete len:109 (-),score=20.36 TRINITY_DN10789_c0_g1_i1:228-554(-)
MFESGENSVFSEVVEIDLEDVLPNLHILTVQEFTLNAQLPLSDEVEISDFGPIEVQPLTIRTFVLSATPLPPETLAGWDLVPQRSLCMRLFFWYVAVLFCWEHLFMDR